jgi:hypothetical protein
VNNILLYSFTTVFNQTVFSFLTTHSPQQLFFIATTKSNTPWICVLMLTSKFLLFRGHSWASEPVEINFILRIYLRIFAAAFPYASLLVAAISFSRILWAAARMHAVLYLLWMPTDRLFSMIISCSSTSYVSFVCKFCKKHCQQLNVPESHQVWK